MLKTNWLMKTGRQSKSQVFCLLIILVGQLALKQSTSTSTLNTPGKAMATVLVKIYAAVLNATTKSGTVRQFPLKRKKVLKTGFPSMLGQLRLTTELNLGTGKETQWCLEKVWLV